MIPFTPYPYSDETPMSFLMRTSSGNGHESIRDLIRGVRKVLTDASLLTILSRPSKYKSLMASLGIDEYPESISEIFESGIISKRRFSGLEVPTSIYREDLTAFCPECLKEALYWRKLWSLRIYTICDEHALTLCCKCSRCNAALPTRRSFVHSCPHCDFDLRRTKSTMVDNATKTFVHNLFRTETATSNIAQLSDYLTSIDKAFDKDVNDDTKMELARSFIKSSDEAVEKLTALLSEYPSSTPKLKCIPLLTNKLLADVTRHALSKIENLEQREVAGISTSYHTLPECSVALGISVRMLKRLIDLDIIKCSQKSPRKKISSLELMPFLKKSPEELTDLIDEVTCKKTGEPLFVSVPDAARLLDHNRTVISRLITAGYLQAEAKLVEGHKKFVVDVKSIKYFQKNYALSNSIAVRFGVKRQTISHKLKTLDILPISGPGIDGAVTNVFKMSDIENLKKSDVKRARNFPTNMKERTISNIDTNEFLSLQSTADLLGIGSPSVLILLKRGLLTKNEANQRKIWIEKRSVDVLQEARANKDLHPLDEVVKKSGFHPSAFWCYFINTKIVDVIDYCSWRYIHRDDVKRIQSLISRYVTEVQATAILGCNSRTLTYFRKNGKIKARKFEGENLDVYFYNRKSIEALKHSQCW